MTDKDGTEQLQKGLLKRSKKKAKKYPGQEHLENALQPEKLENAKNRWEVHKYLAAASRARARAIADTSSFEEGSPFSDSSLNRTFDTYNRKSTIKHKKHGVPGTLSYGASIMVLKFAKQAQEGKGKKKKKNEKPKKVNGWYVISPPNSRESQDSPLSWKDILEKPVKDLENYSEYKKGPTDRILPSRNHRRITALQLQSRVTPLSLTEYEYDLDEETSEEAIKEKFKSSR